MLFNATEMAKPENLRLALSEFRDFGDILTKDHGSDLVKLWPFMDYIEDPDLLKQLMEQQGVEYILYVEPTSPMSGGTAINNYKGFIHWLDGTQTKVQIKGSAYPVHPPSSFREQMVYSRLTDSFPDDLRVPDSYTAVADLNTGEGLMVNEFITDYTSLYKV